MTVGVSVVNYNVFATGVLTVQKTDIISKIFTSNDERRQNIPLVKANKHFINSVVCENITNS